MPKADRKQCESMITTHNPWNLGGIGIETKRCTRKPRFVVKDKDSNDEMGLCGICKKRFVNANGADYKITKLA